MMCVIACCLFFLSIGRNMVDPVKGDLLLSTLKTYLEVTVYHMFHFLGHYSGQTADKAGFTVCMLQTMKANFSAFLLPFCVLKLVGQFEPEP